MAIPLNWSELDKTLGGFFPPWMHVSTMPMRDQDGYEMRVSHHCMVQLSANKFLFMNQREFMNYIMDEIGLGMMELFEKSIKHLSRVQLKQLIKMCNERIADLP